MRYLLKHFNDRYLVHCRRRHDQLGVSSFYVKITLHTYQSSFHALPVARALPLQKVRGPVNPTIWFGAKHDSRLPLAARKVSSFFQDSIGIALC